MSRIINNLNDLAEIVGADVGKDDAETMKSIRRRVYKDTACGAWAAISTERGPRVAKQYVVRFTDSILGPRAADWRAWGTRAFHGFDTVPPSLHDYIDPFNEHTGAILPLPCDLGRTMTEVQANLMAHPDKELHWLTRPAQGAHVARITVYEHAPVGSGVTIGSIVEGSNADVPPITLPYPFTEANWYEAIRSIEETADFMWDLANNAEDDETVNRPRCLPHH